MKSFIVPPAIPAADGAVPQSFQEPEMSRYLLLKDMALCRLLHGPHRRPAIDCSLFTRPAVDFVGVIKIRPDHGRLQARIFYPPRQAVSRQVPGAHLLWGSATMLP